MNGLRPYVRGALVSLAYLAGFLVLDAGSDAVAISPGYELWDPAAAASLILLLKMGPVWAPLVFFGNLISTSWGVTPSVPWMVSVASAALPALIYATAAWETRRSGQRMLAEPNARFLIRLIMTLGVATLVLGGAQSSLELWAGLITPSSWSPTAVNLWLAEFVGVLALLPFFLKLLGQPAHEERWVHIKLAIERWLRSGVWGVASVALEAVGMALSLWIVFANRDAADTTLLYPLFLPLLWLTVRYGYTGAVTANLTLATGFMIWLGQAGMADLDVLELQAFLLSLSTAGLLLGAALSDEREARGQLREQESRYHQVQRRREVAEAMHDIVAIINSERPLSEVLAAIAHQASDLLETDAVGLFLLEEEQQVLSIEASWGISPEFQDELRLPVGSGAVGQAVLKRRPTVVRDLAAMVAEDEERWGSLDGVERTRWFLQHFKTILAVPLLAKQRTLGGMSLYYTSSREISSQDVSLAVSFANQAALALENARLHGEARQLAVLRERQRLARELHDSVTQALYGISLGARTARTRWKQQRADLDEPLEYIQSLADAGLAEMRALIFELRPESLEAEGLRAALERLAKGVAARHELALNMDLTVEPDVPLQVKETFYRLAQESLNNIQKHAQASQVTLRLEREGEKLRMSVADDGRGFDPSAAFPGHLGLRSMRERAEEIDAVLEIDSGQNDGTRVQVSWTPESADRGES